MPTLRTAGRTKTTPATLERYHAKRDFTATSEPDGRSKRSGRGSNRDVGGGRFVVQKHDARRLHYDLRLELDGVLKSWAVTRGPSLVAGEKRLAVEVEDHPLDYGSFEGTIPEGHYGAGSVIVWDRGTWHPEGDPREDLARGRLSFTLKGERLAGRWHLVRTKPRASKMQWLLIKADDEVARRSQDPDVLDEHTRSVVSGRTNEEMAKAAEAKASTAPKAPRPKAPPKRAPRRGARIAAARTAPLPRFVEPCLATLASAAPTGSNWLHEIKFDGYRLQARIEAGRVTLLTRSGLDWTGRFTALAEALALLPVETAILDAEAVVEDARGVSHFSDLQADLSVGRSDRIRLQAFDLLNRDGEDLREASLRERKAALAALLKDLPSGSPIRFSEHMDEDGQAMARHACRLGLEGIVAKRADRPYRSGRTGDWLKVKCTARQELVVTGFMPSTVSRQRVGSLVLGVYEKDRLVHVGRAGTGFTDAVARDLFNALSPLRIDRPPFAETLPAEALRGGITWVEPRLVAEVELRGWTGDGQIRHAAFKGLREDKDPHTVVREEAVATARTRAPRKAKKGRRAHPGLTHPDRVLWPDVGLTKQGLADYYEAVADHILPQLRDRPLSLVRCPDGVGLSCFFQKHAWAGLDGTVVRRVRVGDDEALVIRDLEGLLALVQASVLEIHPWGSRLRSPDKPDRMIFDLDPGEGVGWSTMVEAAVSIRDRLAEHGLAGFARTSGGKGIHVVVPLKPRADWDEVRTFAEHIAGAAAKDEPDRFVATMAKRARKGRIFIDYLRNGRGATAVASYSTRARPGAPVAMPVTWSELADLDGAAAFTVANTPARLAGGSDPWREMVDTARLLPRTR